MLLHGFVLGKGCQYVELVTLQSHFNKTVSAKNPTDHVEFLQYFSHARKRSHTPYPIPHWWRKQLIIKPLYKIDLSQCLMILARTSLQHSFTFRNCSKEESTPYEGSQQELFPCGMHIGDWMNPPERGAGLRKIDSVLWRTTHVAVVLYSCFWDEI